MPEIKFIKVDQVDPGDRVRLTLEDLYTQLDAAIEAVTEVAVTALALNLPTGLTKVPEAALARLLQFQAVVNPGEADGPF